MVLWDHTTHLDWYQCEHTLERVHSINTFQTCCFFTFRPRDHVNVYIVHVLHTFLPAKLPGPVHIKPMWYSSLCSLRTKNPRMGGAMFWCCTIFLCTKIKRFCKTKFSLSHCVFPIPLTAVTCFMHQMISGYSTNALRTAECFVLTPVPQCCTHFLSMSEL